MAFRALTCQPSSPSSLLLLLPNHQTLDLHHLKQRHARLFRHGLHHNTILATKLISSSSLSSSTVDYATQIFNSLPEPDIVSCNALLKLYTQCPSSQDHAILFYIRKLLVLGLLPNEYTFAYVFKACIGLLDLCIGRQVHACLVKNDGVCRCVLSLNLLMDMYFKCGAREDGRRVFERMEERDMNSWNIMVSGWANSGELVYARKLFDQMPKRDVVSWNTMVSAYAKVGEMEVARGLFDRMPERNLVSWNALISGYLQNGEYEEALSVFSRMRDSRIRPDSRTLLSVLSACSGARSPEHHLVDKIIGLAKSVDSPLISAALLNLYAKFGRVEEARRVFDGIAEKDIIAWNAMIAGYSQNQRPEEAIELFRLMQKLECRVKPDGMTMVSMINACAQIGTLCLGEWVHAFVQKKRIEPDVFLMTALVDMYAKCGNLDQSRLLFSQMTRKELTSWNAMINGLAIHGKGNEALELFSTMIANGVVPNDITYIGLLNACSHGGLVEKGLELFKLMQSQHSIVPQIQHYGCVVDLLGRAGRLDEAYNFISNMPIKPDTVIWGSLLGACRCHRHVELAEVAANQLLELNPKHDGNYVLLSNVYASLGRWEEVEKVRVKMRERQLRKAPGCSAVEIDGVVYEFSAGDRSHPRSSEIYAAWDELVEKLKLMGYEPNTGALLRNLDEEDKEEALFRHSEKLALSFALISSERRSPIRIVKNLRICSDCHRAMELASVLQEREIVVRDRNRFHHFNQGSCSCGGYW